MTTAQQKTLAVALANTANLHATFTELRLASPLGTPANSAALTVTQGTIWFDSTYVYVAVANNVVKRASLTSF